MNEAEAQTILKKNKIQAMRQFTMMMKEEKFQYLIGRLVTYRSENGSEAFNLKLTEIENILNN